MFGKENRKKKTDEELQLQTEANIERITSVMSSLNNGKLTEHKAVLISGKLRDISVYYDLCMKINDITGISNWHTINQIRINLILASDRILEADKEETLENLGKAILNLKVLRETTG